VFESGNLDGSIVANDNDDGRLQYTTHHGRIERGEEVQIYESVMRDQATHVTTGLLHAVGYLKDNRVLAVGFDKRTAPAHIGVVSEAMEDANFLSGRGSCAMRRSRSTSNASPGISP
jgi:hypothetical protein